MSQETAKALHSFRNSPGYQELKEWMQNRLTQHVMSLMTAGERDAALLQGACQELLALISDINDAHFTVDDANRTALEKSVLDRELAPMRAADAARTRGIHHQQGHRYSGTEWRS